MVHQEAPVAVVHSEVQVVVDHVDHPATVARPVVMTARHANVDHSQAKVALHVAMTGLLVIVEIPLVKVVRLEEMAPSVLVAVLALKRLQWMGQNVFKRSWLRLGSARDVLANSLCLKAA